MISSMYDQERNEELANHLEEYVNISTTLFILEGSREKDVKKAKKIVLEACENLRKGRPDKVFSRKRYAKYLEQQLGDVDE